MLLSSKLPGNIKKIRELKNVTRKELADHLSITLSGYAKIEQGHVEISFKKIELIAEYLKVDWRQLVDFDVLSLTDASQSYKVESTSPSEFLYYQKLIESLERENALLREKLKDYES